MKSIWRVEWEDKAVKALKKLDHRAQDEIRNYLKTRIATDKDPSRFGEPLIGDKRGLWRYRVENYRIVCRIEEDIVTVLVLDVGHRKNIYH